MRATSSYQGMGMVAENIAVSNSVMNVALAPALEMLEEVASGLFHRWHRIGR